MMNSNFWLRPKCSNCNYHEKGEIVSEQILSKTEDEYWSVASVIITYRHKEDSFHFEIVEQMYDMF